jgi:hypothetical protein
LSSIRNANSGSVWPARASYRSRLMLIPMAEDRRTGGGGGLQDWLAPSQRQLCSSPEISSFRCLRFPFIIFSMVDWLSCKTSFWNLDNYMPTLHLFLYRSLENILFYTTNVCHELQINYLLWFIISVDIVV